MDTSQPSLFPSTPATIKQASFDIACIIDSKGICDSLLWVNPAFFPRTANLEGKNLAGILPDKVSKVLPEMLQQTLEEQAPQCVEFVLENKDTGEEHWFVCRSLVLPSSLPENPLFLWCGRDDTASRLQEIQLNLYQDHLEEMIRIRTEEQLHINEKLRQEVAQHTKTTENLERIRERYYLAIRGSKDAIWDWNLVDDSLYLSEQWTEILGIKNNELPDTIWTWFEGILEEDCSKFFQVFSRLMRSEDSSCALEYRMKHKDGTLRWIFVKAAVKGSRTQG